MEALIQMILPSVVLPLLLSALLWWVSRYYSVALWTLPLIWLPSLIWLIGWPSLVPAEANEWLMLLVIIATLINFMYKSKPRVLFASQTFLLLLAVIAIAWPVMKYQFDMTLAIELLVVIIVAVVLYRFSVVNLATTPTLSMAISSGGMGIVVALGGSILVGQLAGSLASVLAVFAIAEVIRKRQQSSLGTLKLIPVMQIYLAILVIARIFAEIPAGPSALLLVAPLVGLIPATRYASAFSAVSVTAAISWLLLTADSSSYY